MVAVADGDTLTISDATSGRHVVRLAGIDAPEIDQPFGAEAKANLADLALHKVAVIDWDKRDRYGRVVGKVTIGGIDVNLEQIRGGLAWHFKAYQQEQSVADRQAYAQAEASARNSSLGLWAAPTPRPPWQWRSSR